MPANDQGWRAGKPLEDPEKMKRWGRISARPSEYLIHMRRGKVLASSSGQGASCFKMPWDAVAVVPTTVQKLKFHAAQITLEKAGVEITGLAVYRIADPMIAFRMLNFSFPERASEKLAELLVEMFVGAARRLVANLSLEDCLARRKEGLAAELMREIAPVVSGTGRLDDETDRGWGVVIDTIEIQDVRVLSTAVFENLQADFRKAQERRAREAALATERALEQGEAEAKRHIDLVRLVAEDEVQKRKTTTEEAAKLESLASQSRVAEARLAAERQAMEAKLRVDRELGLAKLAAESDLARERRAAEERSRLDALSTEARFDEARIEQERRLAELGAQAERERLDREREAATLRHAAEMESFAQQVENLRAQLALALARRELVEAETAIFEIEVRGRERAQELLLSEKRALRLLENSISQERIQLTVAEKLPELAGVLQQSMGQVNITAVDGANPFGTMALAVDAVLGLARSAGLTLDKREPRG